MATSDAPLQIGRVTLTVNDIATVGAFYESALGLERLRHDGAEATYGAAGRPLLELRADPAARRCSPQEAGLYHTAFLLPGRADLGAWLRYALASGVALEGASDHAVSEALYLSDPEGNGIEVYADRPRNHWQHRGGEVVMVSERLDLDAVAASATAPWASAPQGTVVEHVHLRVGALAEAERFYSEELGFDVTCHYPGAVFLATGGYHHHLGANIWNSRGTGVRRYPSTGLAEVEILADSLRAPGGVRLTDPWGTALSIVPKPA